MSIEPAAIGGTGSGISLAETRRGRVERAFEGAVANYARELVARGRKLRDVSSTALESSAQLQQDNESPFL